jgi:N-methylhydantoinase A/oxoprolinase/acetone carboxylase beta subunit
VLPELRVGGADPSPALLGRRDAFWAEYGTFKSTPLYDADRLEAGNVLEGPGIVHAADTTILVPPGRTLSVDRLGTALLRRTS